MVTFDQLVEHVRSSLNAPESEFDPSYVAKVGDQLLAAIVRATLKGIDHHVNTETCEVYSPIPPPSNIFPAPAVRRNDRAYWSGGRRRRGPK